MYIRHRALCTKGSVQCPCLVLVLVLFGCPVHLFLMFFKGPHPRFPAEARLHRPPHFSSKYLITLLHRLSIDFLWILCPSWHSQRLTKIHPKSVQEPSKIHPNLHLNFDWFFELLFIDFFIQHDMAYIAKTLKNLVFL